MEKGKNIKVLGSSVIFILLLCMFNIGCHQANQNKNKCKSQLMETCLEEQSIKKLIPDTILNACLILRNCSSLEKFYPDYSQISMVETIRDGTPIAVFSNIDKTEYLLAYKHEGDLKNSYSRFEIGFWDDEGFDTLPHYVTNEKRFITESGIRLGLLVDSLVKIKGSDFRVQKNGTEILLIYEIKDYHQSEFLIRYNMSSYFMKYNIKNDVVQQIIFGFDYP